MAEAFLRPAAGTVPQKLEAIEIASLLGCAAQQFLEARGPQKSEFVDIARLLGWREGQLPARINHRCVQAERSYDCADITGDAPE